MSEVCVVKGCTNARHQGSFVGDLCSPCHNIITTGNPGYTVGVLKVFQQYELLKELIEEALDRVDRMGRGS